MPIRASPFRSTATMEESSIPAPRNQETDVHWSESCMENFFKMVDPLLAQAVNELLTSKKLSANERDKALKTIIPRQYELLKMYQEYESALMAINLGIREKIDKLLMTQQFQAAWLILKKYPQINFQNIETLAQQINKVVSKEVGTDVERDGDHPPLEADEKEHIAKNCERDTNATQRDSTSSDCDSASGKHNRSQSPECRRYIASRSKSKHATICHNVLVLGETGTGKSTFINSVFNYINFLTFEEAEAERVLVGIPTQFSYFSEKGRHVTVKIKGNLFDNDPANEDLVEGNSATQNPQSYLIKHPISGTKIRIIDTPGMGDARGSDKDQENVSNIISYLRNIEELHAILIIIDPDKRRFTPSLKYCLDQLLLHLHKSAAKNIVFCFTNSSKTQYEIGQTFPLLKRFVEDINNKDEELISLDRRTCYTFDNVCFRYLCCLDAGERMGKTARNISIEAWEKSSLSLKRLFEHVASLPSHTTKSTTSMFDAKRSVYALTRPIIDLAKNIAVNLKNLSDLHKQLDSAHSKEEMLQKMKKAFKLTFHAVHLERPKTVCTSAKCIEMIDENGAKRKHYKTTCHYNCYLPPSPEIIPNQLLKECKAMNLFGTCSACRCSWKKHMHITYELVPKHELVIDSSVVKTIDANANFLSSKHQLLEQIQKQISEYEEEYKSILKCCVIFSRYLQQGAIAATVDNFFSNLNGLLAVEKETQQMGGNDTEYQALEKLIADYKKVVENEGQDVIPDDEVDRAMAIVYSLRSGGENLEKLAASVSKVNCEGEINRNKITFLNPSPIFEDISYR